MQPAYLGRFRPNVTHVSQARLERRKPYETRRFATYVVGISLVRNLYGGGKKNALVSRTVTPENKSLEERLAALEERVTHLESAGEEFASVDESSLDAVDLYGDCTILLQPSKPVPKMGAPQKMSDEDFGRRRDSYVKWVEALWPEFEKATSAPLYAKQVRKRLLNRLPARAGDQLFQMLLANISGFCGYLMSRRNTREPRRIAYVLAGLSGGLTWRYSLDRGIRNPSKEHIHFRAMREHIRHHHPAWYRELMTKSTQLKAITKIPPACEECERFKSRPERLMPALQVRPYLNLLQQVARTKNPTSDSSVSG